MTSSRTPYGILIFRTYDPAVVSLVLVAHSSSLLDALRQMIGDCVGHPPKVLLAGGTDDGRFGTSLQRVRDALAAADGPDGTVVVYDSGSAWLTISFAIDALTPAQRARVVVSDAPLVEGAMVAAARAGQDAPLAEIVDAASRALETEKRPIDASPSEAPSGTGPD
jgi:phosphoenolpyruvate---glycerone phosphotransferase subunit DhaM